MEYSLTKNLALVVEAQGRYARIKNLKGTVQNGTNPQGGSLYYFSWTIEGAWIMPHHSLEIFEKPPCAIFGKGDKAILDLSGLSLRIGIKIKLF